MSETQEPLVSNPRHSGLQRLRQRVADQATELGSALDGAAAQLGGGHTWTGPAADRFAAEMEGRKQKLRTAAQRLLDAIDTELRSTPERVSATEAKLMRMEYHW